MGKVGRGLAGGFKWGNGERTRNVKKTKPAPLLKTFGDDLVKFARHRFRSGLLFYRPGPFDNVVTWLSASIPTSTPSFLEMESAAPNLLFKLLKDGVSMGSH